MSPPTHRRAQIFLLVLNWEVLVTGVAVMLWHSITGVPDLPAATLIACSQCAVWGLLALVPILVLLPAAASTSAETPPG